MEKGKSSVLIQGCEVRVFHSEGPLYHCFGVVANDAALIRSEAINTIDKGQQLVSLAKQLQKDLELDYRPLRLSSMQLTNLREEWQQLRDQHAVFCQFIQQSETGPSIAHFGAPTEHVHYVIPQEFQAELTKVKLLQLMHQFNSEACIQYCLWLGEEIDVQLRRFRPQASEEYTLQARLEDFCHEIRTPFLTDGIKAIRKAFLKQGALTEKGDGSSFKSLEKEIVALRIDFQQHLKDILDILKQIPPIIQSISTLHPELVDLSIICKISSILLEGQLDLPGRPPMSWGQLVLLLQFADHKLRVVSAVSGLKGLERTNLVFSIRLALAELTSSYADEELFLHCLKWGQKGDEQFQNELRSRVLQNYKTLGIPSTEHKNGVGELNKELLAFLPTKKH